MLKDFPENLHRVVYLVINKRSFESFMSLDLSSVNYGDTKISEKAPKDQMSVCEGLD